MSNDAHPAPSSGSTAALPRARLSTWVAVMVVMGLGSACASAPASEEAVRAPAPLSPSAAEAFQSVCARCHVPPAIGAPLLGDRSEWSERGRRGFETLLRNTIEGSGSMPPLGTCAHCSERDLRELVAFLSGIEP